MDLPQASYLSDEAFKHRLPVVVYLVAVSVVGFLGNTLVLFVYWLRFPPSATRVFVLAMALCDLTTNTIALPLQIISIRYAYDTEDDSFCKVMFAFATFATQASGFILVTVALDRFSRVWRPQGRHLSPRWAIVANCAVVFAAVVVFAPFVPMYGIHSIDSYGSHTVDPRKTWAKMCWVADENVGSLYPFVYNIVVTVSFICGLLLVTLSYAVIGAKLWCMTVKLGESPAIEETPSNVQTSAGALSISNHGSPSTRSKTGARAPNWVSSDSVQLSGRPRRPVSKHFRLVRSRTTLTMSVLTMYYVVNWLPHLAVRFVRKEPINWCENFTDCGYNIYPLSLRSYYLNSAVNAFVYGFYNGAFRKACRALLTSWWKKIRGSRDRRTRDHRHHRGPRTHVISPAARPLPRIMIVTVDAS